MHLPDKSSVFRAQVVHASLHDSCVEGRLGRVSASFPAGNVSQVFAVASRVLLIRDHGRHAEEDTWKFAKQFGFCIAQELHV